MSEKKSLESEIEDAERLHGHLGPFLVIGVRMGRTAKQVLDVDLGGNDELRAFVSVPLSTPFSCVIDGIQVATRCTIGNQKLKVENSKEEIVARFERKNPSRVLRIRLNPGVAGTIVDRMSQGSSVEELAREVMRLSEGTLFSMEM